MYAHGMRKQKKEQDNKKQLKIQPLTIEQEGNIHKIKETQIEQTLTSEQFIKQANEDPGLKKLKSEMSENPTTYHRHRINPEGVTFVPVVPKKLQNWITRYFYANKAFHEE